MKRQREHAACTAILLLIASVGRVLAESPCPSTNPAKARFRTVAWVSTTCRTDANGSVGHQELYVQRGNRAPVVISEVRIGPVFDPAAGRLCRQFGASRFGSASVAAGFFTQLAVSPNGDRVAFELNDRFSLVDPGRLTDGERGIYTARADGSHRIKLSRATGVAPFRGLPDNSIDFSGAIAFSPDGRYLVYIDLGSTSGDGIDAQLWSLRLADQKKVQLTHLERVSSESRLLNYAFEFTDARTVGFYTLDLPPEAGQPLQEFYSVSVDGQGLRKLSPVSGPDGQVIAQFGLTGRRPAVQGLFVDGTAENPMFNIHTPRELFVAFGRNVLQLTRFNRVDVGNLETVVSRNRERAFFSASADPFGCNETHNCQLFSVDTLGGHLRQLTRFRDGPESKDGCFITTDPGCPVAVTAQDGATGSLILRSSCDPLGTNPTAEQLFVMRPDGSGLRQITHARGVMTDTPDVFEVELFGPYAYQ